MHNVRLRFISLGAAIVAALAGCTVHPAGERAVIQVIQEAGKPYDRPFESRELPPLPNAPSSDQLVTYALLSNADVEQSYWQWKSALEQVPQEGTQKTNLMITYSSMISNGTTAASMNALGAGSDPMNNIVLPDKLRTAATVALENARAAGLRFDKARFELRNKVLSAYYDYVLTAEFVRLEKNNVDLLTMITQVTQARVGAGAGMEQDVFRTNNELDMSKNELAILEAKLPQQRAILNALLNREPDAPLDPPATLPASREIPGDGADLLALTAQNNPELQALAREAVAKADAIRRAKQEYWPDFSVNVSTDLAGVTQSLMGSVMLPVLRYQAIDAGIRQAQANLHASEAMRRQASHDLASRVVVDLAMLHDAQRQVELYEKTLLPRANSVVAASQRTYAAGQSSMLDLLDAQRSLIALKRMLAELKLTRERQIADLEAAAALGLTRAAQSPVAATTAVSDSRIDALSKAYLDLANAMGTVEGEEKDADPSAVVAAAGDLANHTSDPSLRVLAQTIESDAADMNGKHAGDQREAFKALSNDMAAFVAKHPPSTQVAAIIYQFHCPMANADWLQRTEETANPYMPVMQNCGVITKKITTAGVQVIDPDAENDSSKDK